MAEPAIALIQLATALAAAGTTAPVFVDERNAANGGSDKLKSKSPAVLDIKRAAATGTLAVYGADVRNANQGDTNADGTIDAAVIEGDGTTTVFDTSIPYVAFANYNWLAVDGWNQTRAPSVLEQGAGAGKYQVSDQGGYGRITFGTAPVDGRKVGIFYQTPAEIVAAATTQFVQSGIKTRDIMWVVAVGGTVSASDVWVRGRDA